MPYERHRDIRLHMQTGTFNLFLRNDMFDMCREDLENGLFCEGRERTFYANPMTLQDIFHFIGETHRDGFFPCSAGYGYIFKAKNDLGYMEWETNLH